MEALIMSNISLNPLDPKQIPILRHGPGDRDLFSRSVPTSFTLPAAWVPARGDCCSTHDPNLYLKCCHLASTLMPEGLMMDDKDGGIDLSADLEMTPEPEVMAKIVEVVENYFSDESLKKDAFLRKHVKRNKQGFVSLKLVASFRKVKALSKDWRTVAYSIKHGSTKLEINESFTKLRRLAPLPDFDETNSTSTSTKDTSNCKVVAFDFPGNKITKDQVISMFSPCGEILNVEIWDKSSPSRPEYLAEVDKRSAAQLTTTTVVALIEFKDPESVDKSIETLSSNRNGNWRNSLKVKSLTEMLSPTTSSSKSPSSATTSRARTKSERSDSGDLKIISDMMEGSKLLSANKKRSKAGREQSGPIAIARKQDQYDSSYNSGSETELRSSWSKSSLSSVNSSNNDWSSFKSLSRSPECRPRSSTFSGSSTAFRPKSYTYSAGDANAPNLMNMTIRKTLAPSDHAVNIIRHPRGPDGTRGFNSSLLCKIRSQSVPVPF